MDLEEFEHSVNFINNRLVELNNDKEKLITKMLGKYTKTEKYTLATLNAQIEYNQQLLLDIDDGQEFYKLEN